MTAAEAAETGTLGVATGTLGGGFGAVSGGYPSIVDPAMWPPRVVWRDRLGWIFLH